MFFSIITTAGWILYAVFIIFFVIFAFYSALEREKRALRHSLAVLFLLGGSAGLLFLMKGVGLVFFLFLNSIVLILLFSFLFSGRPSQGIVISGPREREDERDIIFARFDLLPGDNMESYYREHPERKKTDDRIREKPDLFEDTHLQKAPWTMTLGAAEFDFLENQLSFVSGPVNRSKTDVDKNVASARIKSILSHLGAADSGICALDAADLYSHVGRGPQPYGEPIKNSHPFAIAFAVEMTYDMIRCAPRAPVIVETARRYVDAARISIVLASMIRRLGYDARAHIAGSNYQAMCVPVAWKAGLGEVGRMGILITPRLGPRVRLGMVTTDMPLVTDRPVVFGVQDFCRRCLKCAKNCPSGAISTGEPEEENGSIRWLINRENCFDYWRTVGTDCSRCLFVCPYSKPDNLFHRVVRQAVRSSHAAQKIAVLGDDFFYGRKPIAKKSMLFD